MMMVNWHTVKGAIHKHTKYDTESVYSIKHIFGMEYHIILINLFCNKTKYNLNCFIRKQFYITFYYIYMESGKLGFRKVVSDWLTGDLPDARKRDINMPLQS